MSNRNEYGRVRDDVLAFLLILFLVIGYIIKKIVYAILGLILLAIFLFPLVILLLKEYSMVIDSIDFFRISLILNKIKKLKTTYNKFKIEKNNLHSENEIILEKSMLDSDGKIIENSISRKEHQVKNIAYNISKRYHNLILLLQKERSKLISANSSDTLIKSNKKAIESVQDKLNELINLFDLEKNHESFKKDNVDNFFETIILWFRKKELYKTFMNEPTYTGLIIYILLVFILPAVYPVIFDIQLEEISRSELYSYASILAILHSAFITKFMNGKIFADGSKERAFNIPFLFGAISVFLYIYSYFIINYPNDHEQRLKLFLQISNQDFIPILSGICLFVSPILIIGGIGTIIDEYQNNIIQEVKESCSLHFIKSESES